MRACVCVCVCACVRVHIFCHYTSVKAKGECRIGEGISQAYNTAEGIRISLIEQRQKDKIAAEENNKSTVSKDIGKQTVGCRTLGGQI